jgi:ribosomal protein S18 acetylase RimI-like enzyme
VIRDAVPRDRGRLLALHAASWKVTYGKMLPPDLRDDAALRTHLRGGWDARTFAPPEIVLVAEAAGALTGFVFALANRSPPFVDNVHVAASHRALGVGRALFASLARRLLEGGAEEAELTVLEANEGARRFYRRIGGEEGPAREITFIGRPVAARTVRLDCRRLAGSRTP